MRPAPALPGRAMQGLHSIKPAKGLSYRCRLLQSERAKSLEMPERASQLLARIGAQHGINLAARVFQAGEVDRKRGHRGLSACKAVPAQGLRRQAQERATEMKLVALIVETREPCKQVIPDRRLVGPHRKNAVVLDRQRIEARIAGLVYMEPA